ncbi:EF-hand_domain [Hexamita inflata]|uniref:EF-hand domain n=1 Tax=Hexamita inflata TaxID=28002 RepID=A0AA86R8E8_9EUKA|nr:EF-hand domain [Hexamita inflata]CAI9971157.1 EF-hand domain [Hexamita inflata]
MQSHVPHEADSNHCKGSVGCLYKMELVAYLKRKQMIKYPEEVEPIIKKFDKSGNGKIEFDEFVGIVNELFP